MSPEREQLLDQQFSLSTKPGIPDDVMWGKVKKQAVIMGLGSDIGQELKTRLEVDGWAVTGTRRKDQWYPTSPWDLLIVCVGTMEPIGDFFDTHVDEWERGVQVNALLPLRFMRNVWPHRRQGAKVVFMSGPNTNVETPSYTAYRAGKALLQSLVTTLHAENQDVEFVWFIPGVVKTKIHHQTLAAGGRAANLDRVRRIVCGEEKTVTHDEVFERLKAAIA